MPGNENLASFLGLVRSSTPEKDIISLLCYARIIPYYILNFIPT